VGLDVSIVKQRSFLLLSFYKERGIQWNLNWPNWPKPCGVKNGP
jgi:hypothetical protein